jgi:leucyl aminopeptidase
VDLRSLPEIPDDADVLGVPAFADRVDDAPAAAFLATSGFTGKVGQVVALPGEGDGPARVVVGLGPADIVDADVLRRAAAATARATGRYRRVALDLPAAASDSVASAAAARAVAEGFLLAGYRFRRYKSGDDGDAPATERVDVIGPAGAEVEAALGAGQRVVAAVALARDLGNEPGGALTPPAFAGRAAQVAASTGLTCEVWDEHRIAAERLGGLLGVSRGSTQPPRLVVLGFEPDQPDEPAGTVALVGKGVTFDSGGLTLKPTKMMLEMKIDMAGAAAVLGTMSTLRDLGCPARVVGWLPLTDNMGGGDATRIGDVLRARNGTTIEVHNADAEGRLILADGLALACESRPDAVVDVATLTLAVSMAVGRRHAGLMGNHDGWLGQVRDAAARAGEAVWSLPMPDDLRPQLDSKVADLVNVAGHQYGQTVLGALFLREFVADGIPWAHLDIAGPAFSENDDGEWAAGATGFGVRTLVELLGAYRRP